MQEKANKFRFAAIRKQKVFIIGGGGNTLLPRFTKPRLHLSKISQKIQISCKNLIFPYPKNQHNNLQIPIKTSKDGLK